MNVLQLIVALCENTHVISIVPYLNSFTSCFGLLLNPNANTKKSKQRLMAVSGPVKHILAYAEGGRLLKSMDYK